MLQTSFRYKVILGWINDLSSVAHTGKRWPIIDIDERTLQDYREYFPIMKQWGFDTIAIWGLFISHAWSPDIAQSISLERRRAIEALLDEAHRQGVRVLAGLGLYNWGFEDIIRAHPEVAKDEGRFCWGSFDAQNGVAMCFNTEASKEWQRKVIDFIGEFSIDGFQMQSADQGRCACSSCRNMSDMEYHAAVNNEFASYIRTRWPQHIIAVGGWGMSFGDVQSIPHLQTMSRSLNYITDVTDQSILVNPPIRRQIIEAIQCSFGSLGGTVVVPPQRWERLRWFLPHAGLMGSHIAALAADGGSAYELFAGPLVNPQFEIMTKFVGTKLQDPAMSTEKALDLVVDDVFAPRTSAIREEIVALLLQAEEAYFSKIAPVAGEFDFEPLMGENAGPPIYLDRLSLAGLQTYQQDLDKWQEAFSRLVPEVGNTALATNVITCTNNVLLDIAEQLQKRT